MKWLFICLVLLNTELSESNSFNKSIKKLNKNNEIVLTSYANCAIL